MCKLTCASAFCKKKYHNVHFLYNKNVSRFFMKKRLKKFQKKFCFVQKIQKLSKKICFEKMFNNKNYYKIFCFLKKSENKNVLKDKINFFSKKNQFFQKFHKEKILQMALFLISDAMLFFNFPNVSDGRIKCEKFYSDFRR